MSFKLVVSNKVRFAVKGFLPDEAGVPKPFNFTLEANRLSATELQTLATERNLTIAEVMATKVVGWQGVDGPDGEPVPYSPEGLAQLLDVVGMSSLAFDAYTVACGAKAKN